MNLCKEPIFDIMCSNGSRTIPRKFLTVRGSHAKKEGNAIANKGCDVITCMLAWWRPNKGVVEDMANNLKEA